ncbi:MAG: DUF3291 domain-containing protein [Chryseolinea sp.]
MKFYLAQINIARMLIGPIDGPEMANFVSNLDRINALADESDGFVWRLKEECNNAMSIKIFDDDFMIINMSVWKSADLLFNYVFKSDHVEIFKRRKEWFEKMSEMHMAMWYVQPDQMPTVGDALDRLLYIRKKGETPYAFSFKKRFTEEEANDFDP